jgi:hypothetical protein
MSNKKMIIQNCPAFLDDIQLLEFSKGTCNSLQNHRAYCQNCTDCVLKQIVELCKNIDCPCEYQGADCWECSRIGAKTFADKILKLLDIQEVE